MSPLTITTNNFKWDYSGSSRLDELEWLLSIAFIPPPKYGSQGYTRNFGCSVTWMGIDNLQTQQELAKETMPPMSDRPPHVFDENIEAAVLGKKVASLKGGWVMS